jgi:hypothetical protein
MSEKEYDSLSKALMSLYAPLGDIKSRQEEIPIGSVDSEATRGVAITDDSRNPSVLNEQIYTPNLNTVYNTNNMKKTQERTFKPRENQKINVETVKPGLTSLENNLKENVIPVNIVDEPKETVEDKQTGLNRIINSPLLTDSYFDTILTTQEFKNIYSGHNPQTEKKRKIKPREEKWDASYESKINDPEINKNVIKNNVVDIIDSVIPAFPELKRHKAFNRNSFINLAKFESMAGGDLVNEKTKDYGMFQLNKTNINNLFSTDAFENSFKKYYGGQAENATGYSADDLKKLYDKNPEKFVTEFLKNNHKVNLAVSIAGSIMPNLDAKMSKKQSGGIVKDPYKREPRFI